MLFEKKRPRKGKKKKKQHVWEETTSPTAGIRADTWDARFADIRDVIFYDNEKR